MPRRKAGDLNKFAPLRQTKPLYEQLADIIRQKVVSGELEPGERLPAEVELAASLGVGRPSLREALKILQALGVVSIKHGQGIFVTYDGANGGPKRLTPGSELPPARLHDLFEVRKTLECQAAAWAAERASGETIAQLQSLTDQMRVALDSLESAGLDAAVRSLSQIDRSFHSQLAFGAANAALEGMVGNITSMVQETMQYSLTIPGRPLQSAYDHQRIFHAVRTHRPRVAAEAMFQHLDGIQRCVFQTAEEQLLSRQGESPGGLPEATIVFLRTRPSARQ
ncbi:MAG: FadR/GntR family transcriptional regulator [Chloroflexota bacterium]